MLAKEWLSSRTDELAREDENKQTKTKASFFHVLMSAATWGVVWPGALGCLRASVESD